MVWRSAAFRLVASGARYREMRAFERKRAAVMSYQRIARGFPAGGSVAVIAAIFVRLGGKLAFMLVFMAVGAGGE